MTTGYTPLPETSTSDLVADRLRDAILAGDLKSGDRLIETDLAERFEISRGPVREAIRQLVPEGLVVLRRNRGAVVASPTLDDVLEVYAVRLSLGTVALQQAARVQTVASPQFQGAAKRLELLRNRSIQEDAQLMLEADLAFQDALLSLSQLPRMSALLAQSARDAASFVRMLGVTYDNTDHAALIQRHEVLLDAIRAGSPTAATGAWHQHIRATVEEFTRCYEDPDHSDVSQHPLANLVLANTLEKP